MDFASQALPILLCAAWLAPLASFVLILFAGPRLGKHGVMAGYVATGAIVTSLVLSLIGLFIWLGVHGFAPAEHGGDSVHASAEPHAEPAPAPSSPAERPSEAGKHDPTSEHADGPSYYAGVWYVLGQFGELQIAIGYHIDALTVCMFGMVTLIASCIHFYATGYMHDELHDVTDHEVTLSNGHHLHRPGRYPRFFQFLSLFCFSMLGLVVAGNVAMVFVFWELVGICSYFLIGFYVERKSASTAANKAFIVNRVGDFGMIVGMMALWGSLGTFSFGDLDSNADGRIADSERGLFSLVRPAERGHELVTPDGMVLAGVRAEKGLSGEASVSQIEAWRTSPSHPFGYGLLVVAGLGIFCGCVGKSAQFPLHTWLPDAMEGPTPVSALVHSATMVAAGVYLVGRFFPVFAPEVLLVIAYTGGITLFLAATIAITATDIKRVLAYSTVSQLGYMMLALGVGGWLAGMLHLFTHAFFKSLLFLCSGSVIHACHTNEMTRMGGLLKKMPWTAGTMLVGCLAIAGAGIPFVIGLSGYYSKDAILAQALSFSQTNGIHGVLFYVAAGGAAITAFYMFRLWFMTFWGKPRDPHAHEHAHESPKVMVAPLVVLAVFAVGVAWTVPGLGLSLSGLLEQARPAGTWEGVAGGLMWPSVALPGEHASHAPAIHIQATLVAFMTAACGVVLAVMFYGTGTLSPQDVSRTFPGLHRFLIKKWWFDELYDALFVKPAHLISRVAAEIDRGLIDGVVHAAARGVRSVSTLDDLFDRYFVDGFVNVTANWIYSLGLAMRRIQTGRLRQYVLFIVAATVGLFALASFVLRYERAAQAPVPIRHGQVQRQPTQSMLTLDTQVRGFVPATTDHGH